MNVTPKRLESYLKEDIAWCQLMISDIKIRLNKDKEVIRELRK